MIEIRELGADDWETWRSIRLAALAESPAAFTTALADWQGPGDTEERWRNRLESVPFNVVADRDGHALGMVSALPDDTRGAVELVSLWVAPDARGWGVGDALVRAVIDWARSRGAGSLVLRVTDGNDPAERLYRRHGLRRVGDASDPSGREIAMGRSL